MVNNNWWSKLVLSMMLLSSFQGAKCADNRIHLPISEIISRAIAESAPSSVPSVSTVSEISDVAVYSTPENHQFERPLPDGKIIGGYTVDIKSVPFQVTLTAGDIWCSGILIDKNWILTSGHCGKSLQSVGTSYINTYIHVGSSSVHHLSNRHRVDNYRIHNRHNERSNKDAIVSAKVAEFYAHPNYTKYLDYDFMLIKLMNYNTSGMDVDVAKLPDQNEAIPNNTALTVYGWCKAENQSIQSKSTVRAIDVVKIDSAKCFETLNRGQISDRMFCATNIDLNQDTCMGDTGAPILMGNKAVGVLSWGHGCSLPQYPGVYAKISHVRDWIKLVCGV